MIIDDFQKDYKKYIEEHTRYAEELFDSLTTESKVDIDKNRATVKEYAAEDIKRKENLKKSSIYSVLLIIDLAIMLISSLVIGFKIKSKVLALPFIALVVTIIVLGIIFAVMIFRNKKIHDNAESLHKRNMERLYARMREQMSSLNALFESDISSKIFMKTLPMIKIDSYISGKRQELMRQKYLIKDSYDNKNESTVDCVSGECNGSPFVLVKKLKHYMGTKEYTGTKVITYSVKTSNGYSTRTEVLNAQVIKPFPEYYNDTELIFASEVAPNLEFDRRPIGFKYTTDEKLEKLVLKEERKLEKKADKAIMKDKKFTLMADTDFEVLYAAKNRTNEQQFRVLFPAHTRRLMTNLITNKSQKGIGDNFTFKKRNMINILTSESLNTMKIHDYPSDYIGVEYDKIRDNFIQIQKKYFETFYWNLSPILTIQEYQLHKPTEYIYKDFTKSNFAYWEHESTANAYDRTAFMPAGCQTKTILKTKLLNKSDQYDELTVTAHGYQGIPRVDYVKKYGGDGRYHNVPVEWVEYLPISKDTHFEMTPIPLPRLKVLEKLSLDDFSKFNNNVLSSLKNIHDISGINELRENPQTELSFIENLIKKIEEIPDSDTLNDVEKI